MPGPNDAHMEGDLMMPGLGADEPSEEMKAGMRSASMAKLTALREAQNARAEALSDKEKELLAREEAQALVASTLAAREAAIAKAEAKAEAKAKAQT